jgi:exopolyphosphatase/guanosine-5'-triphosphate,3'-diphosphate pyrophosphatase
MAGLGRDLTITGRLSPDGVRDALKALRRFKVLIDADDPDHVESVATYAVRHAEDRELFKALAEEAIGRELKVLDGPDEAAFSAMGVLAGWPGAQGVVGDLGGSSLELVKLEGGLPGARVSLPLGPFSLGAPGPYDAAEVRRKTLERLAEHVETFKADSFHAVGGAWRSLAYIHMSLAEHPLRIAQHYEINRDGALKVAQAIARMTSKRSLEIVGVSKKRIDALPYAATVLAALVEQLGVKRIWVSAYGLREGLIFNAMPRELREKDPLVEGCERVGAHLGRKPDLGPALAEWIRPIFDGMPQAAGDREAILLNAACRLADIGIHTQPDSRAESACRNVLDARIGGVSHWELAFLAVAIYARYGGIGDTHDPQLIRGLLRRDQIERARNIGLAMRLGCDLSGRAPKLLWESSIAVTSGRLILTSEPWHDAMLRGDQAVKRAMSLASALGLTLDIPQPGPAASVETWRKEFRRA